MHKQEEFATPTSMEDLLRWVQLFPKSEQIYILTAAMMGWNLAIELINQKENKDD